MSVIWLIQCVEDRKVFSKYFDLSEQTCKRTLHYVTLAEYKTRIITMAILCMKRVRYSAYRFLFVPLAVRNA
jgi:hypothetical protein